MTNISSDHLSDKPSSSDHLSDKPSSSDHLSDKPSLFSDIALFAFLTASYLGSHIGVFYKKGVLKNFAKFPGKELYRSPFSNKIVG